jgi:hypothetical protein
MNLPNGCLICFESIHNEIDLYFLPCIHFFHEKCINTWLRKNICCPLCRVPVFVDSPEQLKKFNTFATEQMTNTANHLNNLGSDMNSIAYRFMQLHGIRITFNYNDRARLEENYEENYEENDEESNEENTEENTEEHDAKRVAINILNAPLLRYRMPTSIPNNLLIPTMTLNMRNQNSIYHNPIPIVQIFDQRRITALELLEWPATRYDAAQVNNQQNEIVVNYPDSSYSFSSSSSSSSDSSSDSEETQDFDEI